MTDRYYIIPRDLHHKLASAAFLARGFGQAEAEAAGWVAETTARHGIRTHNLIKALHLDDLFGSNTGGCVPNSSVERLPTQYKATQTWNANRKLGQAVAIEAMNACMRLADEFGVGLVAVDNAFHYLWGGGYVIDAAQRGYIAYTCCTAALAEVVPFGGRFPTLGTNPHSWAFPTMDSVGFPICVDWATSIVAMGRVQQLAREGKPLPPAAAVDSRGNETTDPSKVTALLPFGGHKGYGLALVDELLAAYIGGSLPTLRNQWKTLHNQPDEKGTCCFYFQCIRPDALSGGAFAKSRTQAENVTAVIEDILGHGNRELDASGAVRGALLPGEIEARWARLTDQHSGLLYTPAEVEALSQIARDAGLAPLDLAALKSVEVAQNSVATARLGK